MVSVFFSQMKKVVGSKLMRHILHVTKIKMNIVKSWRNHSKSKFSRGSKYSEQKQGGWLPGINQHMVGKSNQMKIYIYLHDTNSLVQIHLTSFYFKQKIPSEFLSFKVRNNTLLHLHFLYLSKYILLSQMSFSLTEIFYA